MQNKKILAALAIVFALFLVLVACIVAAYFIYSVRTQKKDIPQSIQVDEEPSDIAEAVLPRTTLNSQYNKIITEYELNIKEIDSLAEIEANYGVAFPNVYLLDGNYTPVAGLEEKYNLNGMSYLVDKTLSPAPDDKPIPRDHTFCTYCENNMNLYNPYVRYMTDPKSEAEDKSFSIAFFKYTNYFNKDISWVLKMSFIENRANKKLGDTYNYYMLGYMDVENTKFEKAQIYFQMLDDDGEIDETTTFVIDYMLEDKYGMRFRNTVRGSYDYLTNNYDQVASLVDSFDTTEEYYMFNIFKVNYETQAEYRERTQYEVDKWIEDCAEENNGTCPKFLKNTLLKPPVDSTYEDFKALAYARWLRTQN